MIKFAHTNIVAHDWKKLSQFYQDVFDCEPVYPERNLKGNWIDQATALKNAQIKGIHLRLPGHGNGGPTLEIFQYNEINKIKKTINANGFSHIAFLADNLEDVLQKLLQNGGSQLGKITEREIQNAGIITFVYTQDPEGNIIEIQNWR